MPLLTLTTDFGTSDGYVGTMKGVILTILPVAQVVDISHHIAPQDVRQAAYVLYTAYPFFPSHAVHLVVVDPGVGSARRPIAVQTPRGSFVGPDNGVFSYVMACEPVEALVELTAPHYRMARVSSTFHGRDVFAPAAAHVAAGISVADLGPPVTDPVGLPLPRLEIGTGGIVGEVLHVDRFGNVVSSIGRLEWSGTGDDLVLTPAWQKLGPRTRFRAAATRVVVGRQSIDGVCRAYAEAERDRVLAVVGSTGHLEIAVREGNAARQLELSPGDPVVVQWV
ncbi:MAG TPA: hypothetical protein ENN99_16690 [Chloroflexi bacterium]|nr:hypothetical protein [Chloroflexota bacterium]